MSRIQILMKISETPHLETVASYRPECHTSEKYVRNPCMLPHLYRIFSFDAFRLSAGSLDRIQDLVRITHHDNASLDMQSHTCLQSRPPGGQSGACQGAGVGDDGQTAN
jgi:hypothetical protein